MKYIDDYSACNRTYATLRMYPKTLSPEEITAKLNINPTRTSKAGGGSLGKHVNGWYLSTQEEIQSKDSRRHIDWLIDQLEPSSIQILELQKNEIKIDIMCFWESASGNGGPTLSPPKMKRLADLNIEIWWDVYFSEI